MSKFQLSISKQHQLDSARRSVNARQWNEALAFYEALMRHETDFAEGHYELAWLLRQLGRPLQALASYQQALELKISRPEEIHLNKAAIYSDDLLDYVAAKKELNHALRCRKNYPSAWLNLGNLHEELADSETAAACYRNVLNHCPKSDLIYISALARLLRLVDAPETATLMEHAQKAAFGNAAMPPTLRATVFFAISDVLHKQKAYAEAFSALARANACAAQDGPRYQRARHSAWVSALIGDFAHLGTDSTRNFSSQACNQTPAPLFIIGMFRSGSTLIEQMLNTHPLVHAGGELGFLPRAVQGILAPYPYQMTGVDAHQLQSIRQQYASHIQSIKVADGVRYFTDKRPDNYQLIGLIKRLFPNAKIIHTMRDPVDNGLSIFQQQLDQQVAPYSSSLSDIGHYYSEYRRLMAEAKRQFPQDIFDLDYDELVQNSEPSLRSLLDFLELPWFGDCLNFHLQKSAVKTASLWQVRQPLNQASSGRWRAYAAQLLPLRESLQLHGVLIAAP